MNRTPRTITGLGKIEFPDVKINTVDEAPQQVITPVTIELVNTEDLTHGKNPKLAELLQSIFVAKNRIDNLPENTDWDRIVKGNQRQAFENGSVAGSKIEGVNSYGTLKKLIQACSVITLTAICGENQELIELQLPEGYPATSCYARYDQLVKEGLAKFVRKGYNEGKREHYMTAPGLWPVSTTRVSFITHNETGLLRWFAGVHYRGSPYNREKWVRLGISRSQTERVSFQQKKPAEAVIAKQEPKQQTPQNNEPEQKNNSQDTTTPTVS